jgi:membrane fusion protein, heavy metal efflux system
VLSYIQMRKIFISCLLLCSLTSCSNKETDSSTNSEADENIIKLSAKALQSSGIKIETVEERAFKSEIQTTGEIKANENNVFHINSFVSGRVVKDNLKLGDSVKAGQVLASVKNLEVIKIGADYVHQLHENEVALKQAKTKLALANKTLEREKKLYEQGIAAQKEYLKAESDVELTKAELQGYQEHRSHIQSEAKSLLGAYGTQLGNSKSESINSLSSVISPRSGVVTKKNITLGDMVTPEQVLYEITDLSQLWLDVTIYPKDLERVKQGQTVVFTSDSLPGKPLIGKIDYIQPSSVAGEGAFIARAFFNNTEAQIKPGMFGRVSIQSDTVKNMVFVPRKALQKYGRESFVFVPLGKNRFQKRTVKVGAEKEEGYFLEEGLEAGENIVANGAFTLKAELLKNQFGEED